eukprot:3146387-Amphidinium_carterae.1
MPLRAKAQGTQERCAKPVESAKMRILRTNALDSQPAESVSRYRQHLHELGACQNVGPTVL